MRLAQMLGGDIEVVSAAGEGSSFTVTLPGQLPSSRPPVDQDELSRPTPGHPAGRVVLAIDDDADVISLIAQELGEAHLSATGARYVLLRFTECPGGTPRPPGATGLFHDAWRARVRSAGERRLRSP